MLIINKEYQNTSLVVTVSDLNIAVNPTYQMMLESDFTKKTYIIELSANTSPYPSRYDLFTIDNSLVDDFETGVYSYKIFETSTDKICEVGLIKIVDDLKTVQQKINDKYVVYKSTDATDDDKVVYKR